MRFPHRTMNVNHEGQSGGILEERWNEAATPGYGTARGLKTQSSAISLSPRPEMETQIPTLKQNRILPRKCSFILSFSLSFLFKHNGRRTKTRKPGTFLHVSAGCLVLSISWTYHSLLSAPLNRGLRAWLHSQLMPLWFTWTARAMTSAMRVCLWLRARVHLRTFTHDHVLACLSITVGACVCECCRFACVCVCVRVPSGGSEPV